MTPVSTRRANTVGEMYRSVAARVIAACCSSLNVTWKHFTFGLGVFLSAMCGSFLPLVGTVG